MMNYEGPLIRGNRSALLRAKGLHGHPFPDAHSALPRHQAAPRGGPQRRLIRASERKPERRKISHAKKSPYRPWAVRPRSCWSFRDGIEVPWGRSLASSLALAWS